MKNKLFLLLISIFIFSCNTIGDKNYEKLIKLKKGMTKTEVDSIMNNKHKLIETTFWNDSLFVQYYDSPAATSDDYMVIFDKDSLVVKI